MSIPKHRDRGLWEGGLRQWGGPDGGDVLLWWETSFCYEPWAMTRTDPMGLSWWSAVLTKKQTVLTGKGDNRHKLHLEQFQVLLTFWNILLNWLQSNEFGQCIDSCFTAWTLIGHVEKTDFSDACDHCSDTFYITFWILPFNGNWIWKTHPSQLKLKGCKIRLFLILVLCKIITVFSPLSSLS